MSIFHTYAKIDDGGTHRNSGWTTTTAGFDSRITGGQSLYRGGSHSIVQQQLMGNPLSPFRVDSAVARLNGRNQIFKGFSPEGKVIRSTTNDAGIMDTLVNNDSTIQRSIVRFGKPSSFGLPPDSIIPDWYGLCTVATHFDETGKKTTSMSDGLGRTRRVIIDSAGLRFITRFEYNALSQLIHTVSPRGDSTHYSYELSCNKLTEN